MSVVSALIVILALTGNDLTQDQVIDKHAALVERTKHCTVRAEERWMLSKANSDEERLYSIRRCQIRLDGRRANMLVQEINFSPGIDPNEADSKPGNVNEFNYVCNNQVLRIYYPRDEADIRPAIPAGVTGSLSPPPQDDQFIQTTLGSGATAFGYSSFNTAIPLGRLISLCKQSQVTYDEATGYCIAGTAPDGTVQKIWFDPKTGFQVRRMLFEQSGEALDANRFRHNRRVLKSRFGFSDSATVTSISFEIRNVQIEAWKDIFVVTGLETLRTINASDGSKAIERTVHTLTDWDLDPKFDKDSFQPILPVPEGTNVKVDDAETLNHYYHNGRIELAINKQTVGKLQRVELARRSQSPPIQWMWAIVAAVLGLAWWKMRSGSN